MVSSTLTLSTQSNSSRRQGVKDRGGALSHQPLQVGQAARGHGRGDRLALYVVYGRVGGDEVADGELRRLVAHGDVAVGGEVGVVAVHRHESSELAIDQ